MTGLGDGFGDGFGEVQVAYRADQPGGFKFALVMSLAQLAMWQTTFSEQVDEGKSEPQLGAGAEVTLSHYLGTKPGAEVGTATDVMMSLGTLLGAGKLARDDPNNYVRFVTVENITDRIGQRVN